MTAKILVWGPDEIFSPARFDKHYAVPNLQIEVKK